MSINKNVWHLSIVFYSQDREMFCIKLKVRLRLMSQFLTEPELLINLREERNFSLIYITPILENHSLSS